MQASVQEAKNWKDGSTYPILTVFAHTPEQKDELVALEIIEESVSDIVGKAYGEKLVSTQKGSGQHGLFCVDLSGIITMLKAVKESEEKTAIANAWVANWLKKKVRPEWLPKVVANHRKEYTCRCGMLFKGKKAKKRFRSHQKKCVTLQILSKGLFKRCKQALERIEQDGRESKKSTNKKKSRETKGHRSKQTAKREHPVRRSETRRPKRRGSKNKGR